jgi:predicted dehydrogenase
MNGSKSIGQPPLAPPDKEPPELELPEPVPRKVGYAVVGLGVLAVEEVLPAFRQCRLCEPVALISGHPEKARRLAEVYGIDAGSVYDYESYDRLAEDDRVEVIYIILPNSMHAEYTVRGLEAGKHVLCEKPMAVTAQECERMIAAADQAKRKLMIAYRLHYEPFNRKVMELCKQKAHGELKTFSSSFSIGVSAPNIRLSEALGGGPVGDIGTYCINAARYITGEEPVEVSAWEQRPADDPRFREVPESVAFVLRFPSGVLAHCSCSFGASGGEFSEYTVQCTEGVIRMGPAYVYSGLKLKVVTGDGETELKLPAVNHFAAEMDHFAECVLKNKEPRTPGQEGLADVRVIGAIAESARTGRPVSLKG